MEMAAIRTQDDYTWFETAYTVKSFIEEYRYHLPLNVVICDYDYTYTPFVPGKMFRFHKIVQQKRIVLETNKSDVLSVPLQYDERKFQFFNTKDATREPVAYIDEMYDKLMFPDVTKLLEFENSHEPVAVRVGPDKVDHMEFGKLNIMESYDEEYLVGNAIIDDELSGEPIMVSTCDVPITLRVNSIKVGDLAWEMREERLNQAALRISYSNLPLNQEVKLLDLKRLEDSGYDYIRMPVDENHSEASEDENTSSDYDDCTSFQVPRLPPPRAITTGKQQTVHVTPTLKRPAPSPPNLPASKPTAQYNYPKVKDHGSDVTNTDNMGKYSCGSCHEPQLPRVAENQKSDCASSTDLKSYTMIYHRSGVKHKLEYPAGLKGRSNTTSKPSPNPKPAHLRSGVTAWTAKRQPDDEPLDIGYETLEISTKDIDRYDGYDTISKVPEDVDELSVREVCSCLKLLGLKTFVDTFQKNQIDGVSLRCMTIDMMTGFGMSNGQTKRLFSFILGCRKF